MVGLKGLLFYARLSDRRRWAVKRTGTEAVLELCLGGAAAFAFFRQLDRIAMGPLPMRLPAARALILVLAVAWFFAPATASPSISPRSLAVYPLASFQKIAYRILSYLQQWQVLAILGASVLSVVALTRVPQPVFAIALASALLTVAALTGLGTAIALAGISSVIRSSQPNRRALKTHRLPLFRQGIRYYARILDPYLALLASILAGLTEYFGAWMTPLKATIPLLLIALLQMPAVLNPFGLENLTEMERHLLLPQPYWKLLLQKHLALAVFFLLSALPLCAALGYRMSLQNLCVEGVQLCIVLMSWLLAGMLLMRTRAARRVHMSFGSISGSNMPALLAVTAALLLAVVPMSESFAIRGTNPATGFLEALGVLSVLIAAYSFLVRQQRWRTDKP